MLEGISRALQLDEAERTHLYDLVRAAHATGITRRRLPRARVRGAFFAELFADPVRAANSARFIFLNPRATEFFLEWATVANDAVGILRRSGPRPLRPLPLRPDR